MALLDKEQTEQMIQVSRYFRIASSAARAQMATWMLDTTISDAESRQLLLVLMQNLDRMQILVQMVREGIQAYAIPKLYLDCLINEWEFSWTGDFPKVKTYWPKGMNYGIEAVHEKFKQKGY